MNYLLHEYANAELTIICEQDKNSKRFIHIFSVIELIPHESSTTREIKTERFNLNKFCTVYIEKRNLNIQDAINYFKYPEKEYVLDGQKIHFQNGKFIQEPPSDHPFVLRSNMYNRKGVGAVLPIRQTSLRVWANIDSEREVKSLHSESEWLKIGEFCLKILGFDLSALGEHIGNIYLSGANPYFRSIDYTLSRDQPGVYYRLNLRKGVKPQDITLNITDKRGDILTCDFNFKPKSVRGIIPLPHDPHLFGVKVFNKDNRFIADEGSFPFVSKISFDLGVKTNDVILKSSDGDEKIEKFSYETHTIDKSTNKIHVPSYFKSEERTREHLYKEDNNEFILFAPSEYGKKDQTIKQKAKDKIRELINKARTRCIICDPYFGVKDLEEFVYHIKNNSAEIKILSSKMFLGERINSANVLSQKRIMEKVEYLINSDHANENKIKLIKSLIEENEIKRQALPTHGQLLWEGIMTYNKAPFQKIECRVLRGAKSDLHDRFIIVDNNVWLLGSSLNEFGDRVTSLAQIDSPIKIIKRVDSWWKSKEETEDITIYKKS